MIYVNGNILSFNKSAVATSDRGLLLADGIFTTLRCYQGKPFALEKHWQRLTLNAQKLLISIPLTMHSCYKIIGQLLKENNLLEQDAVIRITITRGSSPRGLNIDPTATPSVIISCHALTRTMPKPLRACLSSYTRNEKSPLAQCKTLAYTDNVMARLEAVQQGFDEAILRNTQGHIVGTSCGNLFIVMNGALITPNIESGTLPGIMRQHVIILAEKLAIPVHETIVTEAMLMQADEIFMTNSVVEMQPIVQVGGLILHPQSCNVQNHLSAYR